MKTLELKDELSNQELTKQSFLFENKTDSEGKIETIMLFKTFAAFEDYLESIDEHYDDGPTIIKEAGILLKLD